jgi:hypothetical protein
MKRTFRTFGGSNGLLVRTSGCAADLLSFCRYVSQADEREKAAVVPRVERGMHEAGNQRLEDSSRRKSALILAPGVRAFYTLKKLLAPNRIGSNMIRCFLAPASATKTYAGASLREYEGAKELRFRLDRTEDWLVKTKGAAWQRSLRGKKDNECLRIELHQESIHTANARQ